MQQSKMPIEKYAVAVRDAGDLFLFMWVKRSDRGEFFAMLPRPHDTSIDAHASLHADGRYHVKSHGPPKIMDRQKQITESNMVGTEHLLDQGLTQSGPRSIGQLCDPKDWSGVFEIPVSDLATGDTHRTHITADLVAKGCTPNLIPEARVIQQTQYRQCAPFLVVTHYVISPTED